MFGESLIRDFCNKYDIGITNPFFLSKTIDNVLFKLNPSEEGFIMYEDTPVFIYINEAYYKSHSPLSLLEDKRFHFSYCSVIDKAVNESRQQRFAATQAEASLFDMTCKDKIVVKRRLLPCKCCIAEFDLIVDCFGVNTGCS